MKEYLIIMISMDPELSSLILWLEALTAPHNEAWALPHARRVFRLAERIGVGMEFDRAVVLCAAYLHDWGAFAQYCRSGVDHALRSKQVLVEEQVLARLAGQFHLTPGQQENILDCVALHDTRDPRLPRTPEALLLREADALDMLGAVGIAREYTWGPNDLEQVTARIRARMRVLRGSTPSHSWFLLPAAQAIAARRLAEMEGFLGALEEEMQA
jgi:uncharacterized protein